MKIEEILKASGWIDITFTYEKHQGPSDYKNLKATLDLFYKDNANTLNLDLGIPGMEYIVLNKTNRLGINTCELRIDEEFVAYCEDADQLIKVLEQIEIHI